MMEIEESNELFEEISNVDPPKPSVPFKEAKGDDLSNNSALNTIINKLKNPEQPNALSSKLSHMLSKSSVAHSINNSIEKHRVPKVLQAIINVAVIEASNLIPPKPNSLPDSFVRLKLGMDKFKTKTKAKSLSPRWAEEFDLYLYEDVEPLLEVAVKNTEMGSKETSLGECSINLLEYEEESTHQLTLPLNDNGSSIFLLFTITSLPITMGTSPSSCLFNKSKTDLHLERHNFGYLKTMTNMHKVGYLQINVVRAVGVAAVDLRGTSDPYCVLQLDNNRVQTHTIYRTVNPEWNRTFNMSINDIHSTLFISLMDENKNRKVEFLGMVALPLLKVRSGEKVWYQLKDCKLASRAKGVLLLQIDYVYNPIRAAVRTFHPKEQLHMKQEAKLKISAMKRNVERARRMVLSVAEVAKMLQSCLSWESKPKSLCAYLIYSLAVMTLELYMLPLLLIVVIVKNFVLLSLPYPLSRFNNIPVMDGETNEIDEDLDSKEEKKSILEKFQGLQEVGLMVQEVLDQVASLWEKIRNMFQWRTPWLTCLGLMILILLTVVLFLVPTRILLLIWGTRKFSMKLFDANYQDNNEVFNYLNRLQCDRELMQHRQLQPDPVIMASIQKEEIKPKSN